MYDVVMILVIVVSFTSAMMCMAMFFNNRPHTTYMQMPSPPPTASQKARYMTVAEIKLLNQQLADKRAADAARNVTPGKVLKFDRNRKNQRTIK